MALSFDLILVDGSSRVLAAESPLSCQVEVENFQGFC
jgi:hypothetical protein